MKEAEMRAGERELFWRHISRLEDTYLLSCIARGELFNEIEKLSERVAYLEITNGKGQTGKPIEYYKDKYGYSYEQPNNRHK